jgi:hypothetical protein
MKAKLSFPLENPNIYSLLYTGRTVWVSRGDIEVIHQGTSIDITLEILSFWQWYLLGETMGITKEI